MRTSLGINGDQNVDKIIFPSYFVLYFNKLLEVKKIDI